MHSFLRRFLTCLRIQPFNLKSSLPIPSLETIAKLSSPLKLMCRPVTNNPLITKPFMSIHSTIPSPPMPPLAIIMWVLWYWQYRLDLLVTKHITLFQVIFISLDTNVNTTIPIKIIAAASTSSSIAPTPSAGASGSASANPSNPFASGADKVTPIQMAGFTLAAMGAAVAAITF